MPENRKAAEVYLMVERQYIMAGMTGQVIDIDINAVCAVMDRYPGGIEDQWECLNKVRAAFYHFKPEPEK